MQDFLYNEFLKEWNNNDSITCQTSGSTGEPQLIKLSKRHLLRSAERTNSFFGIDSSSHLHSAISFKYIGGKMMIVRSIKASCKLSFQEPSQTPAAICGERITLMSVVPTQMIHILDHLNEFVNVENFLIGGAPVSPLLAGRISAAGINAWESYGMTETASHIALKKIGISSDKDNPFIPFKGIEISRNDSNCLVIKDGDIKVETNDIVNINPDGSFHILGRKDNFIITGGKKISPIVIENALTEWLKISSENFYIDSMPDEKWGNKIVMVIKESTLQQATDKNRLKEKIQIIPETLLPRWCRPRVFLRAKEFPLTENLKLKRGDNEFLDSLTVF